MQLTRNLDIAVTYKILRLKTRIYDQYYTSVYQIFRNSYIF